jgi:HlyD family secretion protein
MKRKPILFTLVACAALGAVYFAWQWRQAERGEANEGQAITAFGNVDIRQVDLGFRVEGRLQQLFFEEGDFVKAGELMAILDSEPFEEEIALQKAELSSAQSEFERLQAGFRTQEIKVAHAAVVERQVTLSNLQTELARREALVDEGGVTRQSYDDIKARRDEALARLESARGQLALMEEGFRKEEISKAHAQVESRKARLEIAKIRLNDTRLFAPSSGTVLTRVLEPGSIARVGQTIVTLSISDPAWVRAYIAETALGKIFPGMKAEVYIDSRPDRPYMGRIGFISPKAEFTPKNVETPELRTRLVYHFRVIVDNSDESLRQGMPVTVKLLPQSADKEHSSFNGKTAK